MNNDWTDNKLNRNDIWNSVEYRVSSVTAAKNSFLIVRQEIFLKLTSQIHDHVLSRVVNKIYETKLEYSAR